MAIERELAGKVALVTGGARNIGRAIAETLAAAGATVVINTRSSQRLMDETTAAINAAGGKAIGHLADVTDEAAVTRMVRTTVDTLGRLDILVNNAVSHRGKLFLDLSFEDWRHALGVTLDGAFHCIHACLPEMIRSGGGSVINIGGTFGHQPSPKRSSAAAAKAGLAGLTRVLALEMAPHHINVNCVAPGPVNTVRDAPASIDPKRIPWGRFAELSEIAAMVRLLCGPQGCYVTGQTIHVNGGFYMNN